MAKPRASEPRMIPEAPAGPTRRKRAEARRREEFPTNGLTPPYGDLTELNTCRTLLDTIGKERLRSIALSFERLMGSAVAIYEVNGDYASSLMTSSYCQALDLASRRLCQTYDNGEALACGRWLCHEACWTDASEVSIETRESRVLAACHGGLRIFAVPIIAGGEVIGSINFGYGPPPMMTVHSPR